MRLAKMATMTGDPVAEGGEQPVIRCNVWQDKSFIQSFADS